MSEPVRIIGSYASPFIWGEKTDAEILARTLQQDIPHLLDYLEGQLPQAGMFSVRSRPPTSHDARLDADERAGDDGGEHVGERPRRPCPAQHYE